MRGRKTPHGSSVPTPGSSHHPNAIPPSERDLTVNESRTVNLIPVAIAINAAGRELDDANRDTKSQIFEIPASRQRAFAGFGIRLSCGLMLRSAARLVPRFAASTRR